ncbi:hypothetical protein ACFL4P_02325 [Gemmatimonadota bacterium]
MAIRRCPVCNETIEKSVKMCPSCRRVIRSTFISRYYRPIVFILVMINTALIVFLVGFIWFYGLDSAETRSYETKRPSVEQTSGESLTP